MEVTTTSPPETRRRAKPAVEPAVVVTILCPDLAGVARVVVSKGRMSGELAYGGLSRMHACRCEDFGLAMAELGKIDDELLAAVDGREQLGEGA